MTKPPQTSDGVVDDDDLDDLDDFDEDWIESSTRDLLKGWNLPESVGPVIDGCLRSSVAPTYGWLLLWEMQGEDQLERLHDAGGPQSEEGWNAAFEPKERRADELERMIRPYAHRVVRDMVGP
jgi:hypothetical protein